jgi:hypothetical protein
MNYVQPNKKDKEIIQGNIIFRKIYSEIIEIYTQFVGERWKNIEVGKTNKSVKVIDISNQDLISISYLVAFFGFEDEGYKVLKRKIGNEKYEYLYPVFNSLSQKEALYNDTVKFFGGHQRRLGHYFRNLYQAVKYIDEQKILSYKEKYSYIKLLRAQLSTYEQYIFFFNSVSILGDVWELHIQEIERATCINKQLVTKYNFITNIPSEIFNDINLRDFYPLLVFEGDDKNVLSGNLIINGKHEQTPITRLELEKTYN